MDDAAQWLQWARMVDGMNSGPLYYPLLFAATALGLVLLTYGWWMPRLRRWRGIGSEVDYAIQQARFTALAPLLQRQMADVRPLIARVEGHDVGDEYQANYVELVGKLEGLGVGYPLVNSNTRIWYQYLVLLNELVETGQLSRAQDDFERFLFKDE